MTFKQWLRASSAALTAAAMLQSPVAFASQVSVQENVVVAPKSSAMVHAHVMAQESEPTLTPAQKLALLQAHVKYVFVLFQENRSFDQHFGTFPGAEGLFSHWPSQTPGFVQPIVNTDGTTGTISPFLITQTVTDVNGKTVPLYPADTDSVDHSHTGMNNDLDVDAHLVARNDRYALNQEGLTTSGGTIVAKGTLSPAFVNPSLKQKQKAELVMSHLDCDTIPFLWQYADHFTLFDNFRQSIIGPSTPNAIAMIAGQSGQTQWALHSGQGSNNTASPVVKISGGEPVVGDPGPFAGSNLDQNAVKPPYGVNDEPPATPTLNQTYATLPLSFQGPAIKTVVASDPNPALDLPDVQHDIETIAAKNKKTIPWGWYQQGYDREPFDTDATAAGHASYITHHNGPQYFGYIASNPAMATSLHGLGDFFTDMSSKALPSQGGVFYVRGGYNNNSGLVPVGTSAAGNFYGNDDHPAYSDAQISEALLADEINAIAASPYWSQSAIIISYDETDGLYDHVPPQIRSLDPEGNPLAGGPRVPTIVISPYARAHAIDHNYAEHSSVIKFIDELFNLVPLGRLPDEVRGRQWGSSEFGQNFLNPGDAFVWNMDDLMGAFDNGRLMGTTPVLPASYAMIPPATVHTLPHYADAHGNAQGCYTLNIVPTDYKGGVLLDPPPADFNPRFNSAPGIPTSGTWTP